MFLRADVYNGLTNIIRVNISGTGRDKWHVVLITDRAAGRTAIHLRCLQHSLLSPVY